MLHRRAFIVFIFSVITLFHIIPVPSKYFAYANVKPKKGEKILVEVAYENHAWGYHYKGTVILTDGSIHDFDSRADNRVHAGSTGGLRFLTKKIGDVSKEDLIMIKKYVAEVKEKLTHPKNIMADAGDFGTIVYDYTASREVLLQKIGDWTQLNTDKSTGKLRQIIYKYIPGSCFHDFVKPRKGENVLVENTVIDHQGDIVSYSGTVILTDGSIYYFCKIDGSFFFNPPIILDDDGILNFDDSYRDKGVNDKKDYHRSTLTRLTKKIGVVSQEDLKMIKKYAAEVKEKMTPPLPRNTLVSNKRIEILAHTTVYDYIWNRRVILNNEDNWMQYICPLYYNCANHAIRKVMLNQVGNWPQKNNHEVAEKLNQIIKKYPHTPPNPLSQ